MTAESDSHDPGATTGSKENPKIIDLEFETLRQFREVMAPRLNYDGFFVATNDPLPRGTPARFRFLLPDGFVLADGTGVVAWVRYEEEGPERPGGMALLFDQLEQQSREIIDELIDFHIATGGDPFDIGPRASEAGEIGTDALTSDRVEVPPDAAEREPEASESTDSASQDFLPDWLSEVARKHEVDFPTGATIPIETIPDATPAQESSEPKQQVFDVSLIPEGETPTETPRQSELETAPDITMAPREPIKPPRDLRLRLVLPIVAVLLAASAIVFWIANRGPASDEPIPEVVLEEVAAEEPATSPANEEPLAEEPAEEASKPLEVFEQPPVATQLDELSGPATRILLVATTRVADETVVTIRTNGELMQDRVRVSPLENPARVWVRIQGIETFYRPNEIAVGSPEVERIRVGHHPEETPQSIYVVIDLANTAAKVREYTVEGDTLRVVVGRQ